MDRTDPTDDQKQAAREAWLGSHPLTWPQDPLVMRRVEHVYFAGYRDCERKMRAEINDAGADYSRAPLPADKALGLSTTTPDSGIASVRATLSMSEHQAR